MHEIVPDRIWGVDHEVRMPGGVTFPVRMSVVKLHDGTLLLHNPVPIDDALLAELDALGTVSHIVAPNQLHHLSYRPALALFPSAIGIAAPGVQLKQPGVRINTVLGKHLPPRLREEFSSLPLEGMTAVSEVALLHNETKTLWLADLVFHVHEAPNLQTQLMFRAIGCWQCLRASRSVRFVFAEDMKALATSCKELLELDFDRLIPVHGRVVETDAKAALQEGLSWVLEYA